MKRSIGVIHLGFPRTTVACLGDQMADVLEVVESVSPGLVWYAADIENAGPAFIPNRTPSPQLIGRLEDFLPRLRTSAQFLAGVFAGAPASVDTPCFRDGGLWTEDPSVVDLADTSVEVRAFDTTYIEVISTRLDILKSVGKAFGAPTDFHEAP